MVFKGDEERIAEYRRRIENAQHRARQAKDEASKKAWEKIAER